MEALGIAACVFLAIHYWRQIKAAHTESLETES
jgi:hypothetical protein